MDRPPPARPLDAGLPEADRAAPPRERLPWPAAALVILGVAALLWAGIGALVSHLIG